MPFCESILKMISLRRSGLGLLGYDDDYNLYRLRWIERTKIESFNSEVLVAETGKTVLYNELAGELSTGRASEVCVNVLSWHSVWTQGQSDYRVSKSIRLDFR